MTGRKGKMEGIRRKMKQNWNAIYVSVSGNVSGMQVISVVKAM